jgi:polyhydroxyalkanoate synthesis regulator phasin
MTWELFIYILMATFISGCIIGGWVRRGELNEDEVIELLEEFLELSHDEGVKLLNQLREEYRSEEKTHDTETV